MSSKNFASFGDLKKKIDEIEEDELRKSNVVYCGNGQYMKMPKDSFGQIQTSLRAPTQSTRQTQSTQKQNGSRSHSAPTTPVSVNASNVSEMRAKRIARLSLNSSKISQ